MKKIWMTATAMALVAGAASAQVNLDLNLGGPAYAEPAYVEPAPAYVYHDAGWYNGRDRHRHYDYNYWHDGRRDHGVHNGWHR